MGCPDGEDSRKTLWLEHRVDNAECLATLLLGDGMDKEHVGEAHVHTRPSTRSLGLDLEAGDGRVGGLEQPGDGELLWGGDGWRIASAAVSEAGSLRAVSLGVSFFARCAAGRQSLQVRCRPHRSGPTRPPPNPTDHGCPTRDERPCPPTPLLRWNGRAPIQSSC